MIPEERQQRLASLVHESGSMSVRDLAERVDVSEATVRRDLEHLSKAGRLKRVRGGACSPRAFSTPEVDPLHFSEVVNAATREKALIARRAADLVEDGDVIAMDIGTTVAAMCPLLRSRRVTILTASLAAVRGLEGARDVDIIVLGGQVRSNYQSMVGFLTESALRQFRIDIAFLGCSGVLPDGSVLDSTPSEVPVKRTMMGIAARSYLLADHEKFPGSGIMEVAPLSRFAGLITDQPPTLDRVDNSSSHHGYPTEVLTP